MVESLNSTTSQIWGLQSLRCSLIWALGCPGVLSSGKGIGKVPSLQPGPRKAVRSPSITLPRAYRKQGWAHHLGFGQQTGSCPQSPNTLRRALVLSVVSFSQKKGILKVLISYTLGLGSPPGVFSAPLYLILCSLGLSHYGLFCRYTERHCSCPSQS